MENTASQHSCISRPASTSSGAGESSWAMHFACSLVSSGHGDQQMDRQRGGVGGDSHSSFSSSFDSDGDDGSFITSDMVCDAEDGDEDDSLQDTACSSAAKETSTAQLAKCFVDASSRQRAVHEVICGANNSEDQLRGCNDLRKRGLCLVPLSMLIDYLG